jgi:hypothetical protein
MDLMLIELVLWGGLLFFLWALKDGLGRVETDIESLGMMSNMGKPLQNTGPIRYYRPDDVDEQIGSYLGSTIYRYVVIDGRRYEFDRISAADSGASIASDERCVVPGLVYQECASRSGGV